MKRIIALLLSLVLFVSLFAGCSNSDKKSVAENTNSPSSESTPSSSAASSESESNMTESAPVLDTSIMQGEQAPKKWLCEEKTTLTVSTYDAVSSTYFPPSNDLWFWQQLEDYTNVHIEWDVSPIAGYNDIVNTKLAAGVDLTDIMVCNNARTTRNAGDSGIFVDMSPYWDTCFTNTQAYFSGMGSDLKTIITNPNGAIYAIPNTNNPTEGRIIFCYNTLWMDKLGAKVPTTLDEFTDLMYLFQSSGDLNGNGIPDEIPLTSSSVDIITSVLGNAFNLEQYDGWDAFNADENGVVYPEYTTDNMRAYLTYLNKLFEDGVLDNEICYMSMDTLAEKVASDRIGCFIFFSGFAIGYGSMTPAGIEDPLKECFTLGLPLASEYNNNEPYFVRRTLASGNTGAAVTYECKNVELACKWLDTLYADPYIMYIRAYGKEGETFEILEDGSVMPLKDENGEIADISAYGCGQLSLPFVQTTEELLLDKLAYDWYLEQYELIRNCTWKNASVPKVTVFTREENEIRNLCNSEVLNFWYEARDKFITGVADIETEWDTYVNGINAIGMEDLTKVWQMVYDRMK